MSAGRAVWGLAAWDASVEILRNDLWRPVSLAVVSRDLVVVTDVIRTLEMLPDPAEMSIENRLGVMPAEPSATLPRAAIGLLSGRSGIRLGHLAVAVDRLDGTMLALDASLTPCGGWAGDLERWRTAFHAALAAPVRLLVERVDG